MSMLDRLFFARRYKVSDDLTITLKAGNIVIPAKEVEYALPNIPVTRHIGKPARVNINSITHAIEDYTRSYPIIGELVFFNPIEHIITEPAVIVMNAVNEYKSCSQQKIRIVELLGDMRSGDTHMFIAKYIIPWKVLGD